MITSIEPQVSDTGRYSVTETCSVLGIHRNSLRKYTDMGLIKCGFRKLTARKFYAGREILRFWRSQPMSEKDKSLIEQARKTSYIEWYLISDLIEQAESREAKEMLHSIQSSKYHTEEYYTGIL